ncbi:uncharacterized protein LOC122142538 [Tachysurus ichikawai]
MTRKIELGWIHDKKQVRKRNGGGTRVPFRNSSCVETLWERPLCDRALNHVCNLTNRRWDVTSSAGDVA